MREIILHSCCAPCSAAIIEWMMQNDMRPTIFYCNPNIYPSEEYQIRKEECSRYAKKLNLSIIESDYDHEEWLKSVSGFEEEPERGARCLLCFKYRLNKTAEFAVETGINLFATTLSSSRWKSLPQITEAGEWAMAQIKGSEFYDKNWRKGGLQQRRNELLAENKFYNQNYCGCEFSIRKEK